MLELNFYKVRTGINILQKKEGGDDESQQRYEQILQTIAQRTEIEYLSQNVIKISEKSPNDLPFYEGEKADVYVMIFGVSKTSSSWTASSLTQAFGNMRIPKRIYDINPSAVEWIGGSNANISCEAALFDLRTKK